MKKKVIIVLETLFLIIGLFVSLSAQTSDDNSVLSGAQERVEKGYSCLESKLGDNCGGSENTEQLAFSLLAIGYNGNKQKDCRNALLENAQNKNCFGKTKTSPCDLESTALAVIALNEIGENTQKYVDWILSKKKIDKELEWFLEIDVAESEEDVECEIEDGGRTSTFKIKPNKKIEGRSECLKPAEGSYFLKIDDSCLEKNFTISCDLDFITTLLYKKPGSNTYHVSSKTHEGVAFDSTQERVESYCFGESSCDFEGSLWATHALNAVGRRIGSYLPYLLEMSLEEKNKKYFPEALMYLLTGSSEYYAELMNSQEKNKYWDDYREKGKYYSTALALLALSKNAAGDADNVKNYLLSVQGKDGCWGDNIRDTAFILYAGWPKKIEKKPRGGKRIECEEAGYHCTEPAKCSEEDILDKETYHCPPPFSNVCCKVEPLEEKTCEEKGGVICQENERCEGELETAKDTISCCIGKCEVKKVEKTECEKNDFVCKSSCEEDEEEKNYSCGYFKTCCGPKEGGGGLGLIIILIILIILVIIGIIYRNKLRDFLLRFRKKGPSPPTTPQKPKPPYPPRPPYPLYRMGRRIIPQRPIQPPSRIPPQRPQPKKPDELDETMEKLKKMAK